MREAWVIEWCPKDDARAVQVMFTTCNSSEFGALCNLHNWPNKMTLEEMRDDAAENGYRAVKVHILTEEEKEESKSNEYALRELLWLRHGCQGLYGGEGEMQCGSCLIDFKRMPVKDILARFEQIGRRKLDAAQETK